MKTFLLAAFIFSSLSLFPQSKWQHGRLKVANDGHHLVYKDGTTFFWLGDTAWELFHRLTKEEIQYYLDNRKAKGFNVIQAVVLAEFDGLKRPNQYGEVPLKNLDPATPNEKYFTLVDETVKMAAERQILIGLLPTWGDKVTKLWGEGPVIFNEANAFTFGKWIGARYRNSPNIIWILGGDRPPRNESEDWRPIWRAMAKGIRTGTVNQAIITYHISGGRTSTSNDLHSEDWLDINMMQSGHGSGHDVPVWDWITSDYQLKPAKPTLDSEPNYEDHPVNPWPAYNPSNGYFRDYDVRKQTYRSVFAGGCGVTYGNHSMWQFWSPRETKVNHADRYWTDALDRPGAFQIGYLRKLMLSRPFLKSVPDQNLIEGHNGEGGGHNRALRASDGSFAMIYLPVGKEVTIKCSLLIGDMITVWWFNPRNGTSRKVGVMKKDPLMTFTPPTLGVEEDWVLVIDDSGSGYGLPGSD